MKRYKCPRCNEEIKYVCYKAESNYDGKYHLDKGYLETFEEDTKLYEKYTCPKCHKWLDTCDPIEIKGE